AQPGTGVEATAGSGPGTTPAGGGDCASADGIEDQPQESELSAAPRQSLRGLGNASTNLEAVCCGGRSGASGDRRARDARGRFSSNRRVSLQSGDEPV